MWRKQYHNEQWGTKNDWFLGLPRGISDYDRIGTRTGMHVAQSTDTGKSIKSYTPTLT